MGIEGPTRARIPIPVFGTPRTWAGQLAVCTRSTQVKDFIAAEPFMSRCELLLCIAVRGLFQTGLTAVARGKRQAAKVFHDAGLLGLLFSSCRAFPGSVLSLLPSFIPDRRWVSSPVRSTPRSGWYLGRP